MAASPQLENGFTRIANEIAEALMRTNISAYQGRVLWAIWRETYGFQKKEAWISNSRLVGMTGLRKQHVSRTIKELLDRHIVTRSGYKVGFNKDYTQWRELPRQVTVSNSGYKVTQDGYPSNQSRGTTKKIKRKTVYRPSSGKDADPNVKVIIDHYFTVFEEIMKVKPELGPADASSVKRELKKRNVDEIKNLIEFAVDVFFRHKPEGKGLVGTLKSCFAAVVVQTYRVEWEKRKWQYSDSDTPITTCHWWH